MFFGLGTLLGMAVLGIVVYKLACSNLEKSKKIEFLKHHASDETMTEYRNQFKD